MTTEPENKSRRRLLIGATTVVAGVGAAFVAVPFIESWEPSARTRSEGGPVTVNFSKLEPGQMLVLGWRQKPIFIVRRTADMLARMKTAEHRSILRDPDSKVISQQPTYTKNADRAIQKDIYLCVGLCTHLGCIPTYRPEVEPADLGKDWQGGWFCPCHGSKFDLAGRVYEGVPAQINLLIPPYHFVQKNVIQIGVDPETAKKA